ncbi:MAG: hypothetical protein PHE58_04415 [Candidatus Omnitrophica bacterium]|nr:hypothetical protein [Candidatus Omnitrophota bacterium]
MIKKLNSMIGKVGKTQSEVLRGMLDSYFKGIEKTGLPFEPYRKTVPGHLRILPRTINKAQDAKIRDIASKTGRALSDLIREAVDRF